MKAITDIGQAVVRASGKEVFLNPSFLAMSRIGSPEQIVDAFVKVHAGITRNTESPILKS